MTTARGPFDVKLLPIASHAAPIGRMSIDKQFRGDLEGTSTGEMLAFRGEQGSAGYVAMEQVSGTLHGKRGTFVLQHSSTLNRGAPTQSITVVPDSGTDQLVGLSGRMVVIIEGKAHSYDFEYSLS
jgi:hypothetical protein